MEADLPRQLAAMEEWPVPRHLSMGPHKVHPQHTLEILPLLMEGSNLGNLPDTGHQQDLLQASVQNSGAGSR